MLIILCFVLGIGNFAMHRAVVESGHPFVEDAKLYFGKHFGKFSSYIIEFIILTAAMLLSGVGYWVAAMAYLIYTGLNALAAWMLLSGRM